jgi:GH18 family chitinase
MKTYGFDGIDLDWEYPVSGGLETNVYRPQDKQNYVLLVKEIRRQLDALEAADGVDKHYLLTIASPAGDDKIKNYDLDAMEPYLDFFDLMAYDFHGGWEPNKTGHNAALYGTSDSTNANYYTDFAVDLYIKSGVDPSKIVLGTPMYGRSWGNVEAGNDHGLNNAASGIGIETYRTGEGVVAYWQIQNLLDTDPNYQVYWDDQAKASYIYNAATKTFITYESLQALQLRLDYIKDLGLGGIMFWEFDDDIRNANDPRSLLGLAAKELLDGQDQTA